MRLTCCILYLHADQRMNTNVFCNTGWEWDEEKIQSEKIPDDVAMFFVATISTLDPDVKLALGTLSCFGNS
eukprot:scaffold18585_cov98-Cyclotella_meneghiniana.AAC.1